MEKFKTVPNTKYLDLVMGNRNTKYLTLCMDKRKQKYLDLLMDNRSTQHFYLLRARLQDYEGSIFIHAKKD